MNNTALKNEVVKKKSEQQERWSCHFHPSQWKLGKQRRYWLGNQPFYSVSGHLRMEKAVVTEIDRDKFNDCQNTTESF